MPPADLLSVVTLKITRSFKGRIAHFQNLPENQLIKLIFTLGQTEELS